MTLGSWLPDVAANDDDARDAMIDREAKARLSLLLPGRLPRFLGRGEQTSDFLRTFSLE